MQTTQEMHNRADWLVPYFDGALRLTKPPLNYWLTGVVTWASSDPFVVSPWHARFPSALAGVLLAWFTIVSGTIVRGRSCGSLSGWICTTSYGFLVYTHSARPEMVYAAANAAAILCFLKSWHLARAWPERHNWWRYGIWVSFGVATLSKGPHVPALILAGMIIGWAWAGESRRNFRLVSAPGRGLLIWLAMAAPWWVLLYTRLAGTDPQALAASQLAGSLYEVAWLEAVYPKYLLITPQLVLPWIVLLPGLAALRGNLNSERKILIAVIAVPALVMNFGTHRHSYYMLPLLMPMALMLADSALLAVTKYSRQFQSISAWIVPAHVAVIGIAGAVFIGMGNRAQAQFAPLYAGAFALLVASCIFAYRERRRLLENPMKLALLLATLFAGSSAVLIANGGIVSQDRWETARLATLARPYLVESRPFAVLDFSGTTSMYYAQQSPVACGSGDAVRNLAASTVGGQVVCLTTERGYNTLSRTSLDLDVLAESAPGTGERMFLLMATASIAEREAFHS